MDETKERWMRGMSDEWEGWEGQDGWEEGWMSERRDKLEEKGINEEEGMDKV